MGDYAKSLDAFEALLSSQANADRSTLKSDPRARELIETITDAKTYLEDASYGPGDLANLAVACNRTNELLKRFMLFGIKDPAAAMRNPTQIAPEVRETIEVNIKTFLPEIERLKVFGLRCAAKQITLTADVASAAEQGQPVEAMRKGVQQMRMGSFVLFIGSLVETSQASYPINYRRQLAAHFLQPHQSTQNSSLPISEPRSVAVRPTASSPISMKKSAGHLRTLPG